MDPRTFWYSFGLFLIALNFYFLLDQSLIFYLVEYCFSPDNHLTVTGKKITTRFVYFFCAWGILVGALALKLRRQRMQNILYSRIFSDNVNEQNITRPQVIIGLYVLTYVPVFVLGVLHYYGSKEYAHLFNEDGVFETLTAIVFLVSAVIFFFAAFKSHTTAVNTVSRRKHLLVPMNIACGLLFFGIGMEEISWGQRIFDFTVPTYMLSGNYQDEFNIHNYFNPYRVPINQTVASFMLLVLLLGWFRTNIARSWFFDYFFPHGSLIFLSFMLILVGGAMENEMFEELVAVIVAFHSYRAYELYRAV